MATQNKEKTSFIRRIRNFLTQPFKIIFYDEAKFHEVFSFRHRLMNLVLITIFCAILLIAGTIMLIKYSSLRQYVFADGAVETRRKTTELLSKVEDLETKLKESENYIKGLSFAISGDIKMDDIEDRGKVDSLMKVADKDVAPNAVDSSFRQNFEDRYLSSIETGSKAIKGVFSLSVPVRSGVISKRYNINDNFRAIEISAKQNSPVFACMHGMVIYKEWIPARGNVVIIEHSDNLVSIYRNLSTVPKHTGEKVGTGELIGLTADKTSVFELWIDGAPVNPEMYMNFEI